MIPTQAIQIPWGDQELNLNLPAGWNLAGVMHPTPRAAASDTFLEVQRGLSVPYEMPRLSELARAAHKVVLIIDDDSRPTPVAQIFPAVMAELQQGGVQPEQITLIPALGVHYSMTPEQVARRIGVQWLAGLCLESHDCDDPDRLAFLGTTHRGTPVYVNKTVAEADLVVAIGCIEPHIIASFGGGYTNIVPGVAGRVTIAHNHALNCHPNNFNNVGQPIELNPMRLDLEEAGGLLKPPVFIINAVLNRALQPVEVVCGHPVTAHRAGVQTSAAIYGAPIPDLADIVITNSHPMDQDLRQGVKALANTIRALRPGGTLISLVRAEAGLGVFGLANSKLPVGHAGLRLLAPALLPLVPRLKLKGLGEEDRFFLYFVLQAMRHCDLLMYAPTISTDIHARLPFVTFVEDLEAALQYTRHKFPHQADVLVFPHGGITYPVLPV